MEQRKAEDPEGAEGELDSSEWNYGADLDLIKAGLSKIIGRGQEYVQIRNLITTCVSQLQKHLESREEGKAPEDVRCQSAEKLVRCRNPLEIDLILNQVLSYVPLKSLLTCRQVNQNWNAIALPWIPKKLKKTVAVYPEEFPMFCAEFDCTDVIPFESLNITLQGMNKDDCHKFFTKHGSQLRKLESNEYMAAEGANESTFQESLQMLQHILRLVPNLKTLDLNLEHLPKLIPGLFDFDEGESVTLTQVEFLKLRWMGSLSQGFLDGLSSLLPNITGMQLEIANGRNNEQDWEAFGNFLRQRLSLHTIRFPVMKNEAHHLFRVLTTPGSLKLKELNMYLIIYLSPFNTEELRIVEAQEDFLRSQSDNLEILSLAIQYHDFNRDFEPDSPPQPKRQFPVLRNLKTAAFFNNGGNYVEHKFAYFPLEPEHLPNLQNLSFVRPKTMESEVFADSIFLSVQEVVLDEWRHMNTHLLPELGRRFPNLRKLSNLEINVDVNAIETIVSNFPGIEDLELKFFDRHGKDMPNFNLVISGIPAEKWPLAQNVLADCLGSGDEPNPNWIDPPGPSLRDLKCLKRLVLKCDPFPLKRPRFVRIDEIGVYLTFLRLSSQLNLTFRGTFSISDELAAKLRGHYQNIYFIPAEPKEAG